MRTLPTHLQKHIDASFDKSLHGLQRKVIYPVVGCKEHDKLQQGPPPLAQYASMALDEL